MVPRDKDTNERLKDERREQILQHALQLFVRKGLSATRMADIADAAGISQGLAYHYYKSKEDIFVELIKVAYERMTEAAKGLKQLPLSPQEKITLAAEKLIQGFAEGESAALNFLLIIQASVFETVPAEAKEMLKGRSLLHEIIASIVEEGQQQGKFNKYDPAEMALAFWSALVGLAVNKAILGAEFKAPDSRILLEMFMDMGEGMGR